MPAANKDAIAPPSPPRDRSNMSPADNDALPPPTTTPADNDALPPPTTTPADNDALPPPTTTPADTDAYGTRRKIEELLIEEYGKAIAAAESPRLQPMKLFWKMDPFQKFKELKVSFENDKLAQVDQTMRIEKLYELTNLVTEWGMLLKQQGVFNSIAIYQFTNKIGEVFSKIEADLGLGKPGDQQPIGTTTVPDATRTTTAPPAYLPRRGPDNLDVLRGSSGMKPLIPVRGALEKVMFMERLLVRKENLKGGIRGVGFHGMVGVGKTAFCQAVINHDPIRNHYFPIVWACLSKQKGVADGILPYRKNIVEKMLLGLGLDSEIVKQIAGVDQNGIVDRNASDERGLRNLLFALRRELRGKRYLVVLDDAWMEDKFLEKLWDRSPSNVKSKKDLEFDEAIDDNYHEDFVKRLAYGLPKGSGGTVMVTSRSKKMIEYMIGNRPKEMIEKMIGDESYFEILPFKIKHRHLCWDIFKDTIEKERKQKMPTSEEVLDELYDFVVHKCEGLPLAAKMMATIMADQRQEKLHQQQIEEAAERARLQEASQGSARGENQGDQKAPKGSTKSKETDVGPSAKPIKGKGNDANDGKMRMVQGDRLEHHPSKKTMRRLDQSDKEKGYVMVHRDLQKNSKGGDEVNPNAAKVSLNKDDQNDDGPSEDPPSVPQSGDDKEEQNDDNNEDDPKGDDDDDDDDDNEVDDDEDDIPNGNQGAMS